MRSVARGTGNCRGGRPLTVRCGEGAGACRGTQPARPSAPRRTRPDRPCTMPVRLRGQPGWSCARGSIVRSFPPARPGPSFPSSVAGPRNACIQCATAARSEGSRESMHRDPPAWWTSTKRSSIRWKTWGMPPTPARPRSKSTCATGASRRRSQSEGSSGRVATARTASASSQWASRRRSSEGPTGLATKSEKPASRQAACWSSDSVAVSATIGSRAPCRRARMRRVASRPFMPGICTSISTRSHDCSATRATASAPLSTTTGVIPAVRRRCTRMSMLIGWSSTTSTRGSTPRVPNPGPPFREPSSGRES